MAFAATSRTAPLPLSDPPAQRPDVRRRHARQLSFPQAGARPPAILRKGGGAWLQVL